MLLIVDKNLRMLMKYLLFRALRVQIAWISLYFYCCSETMDCGWSRLDLKQKCCKRNVITGLLSKIESGTEVTVTR